MDKCGHFCEDLFNLFDFSIISKMFVPFPSAGLEPPEQRRARIVGDEEEELRVSNVLRPATWLQKRGRRQEKDT